MNCRCSAAVFLAVCVSLAAAPGPATAQQAIHHEHADGRPSTSLTIRTPDHTLTLSVADLQALPQTTVDVFNAHSKHIETYSGPLVSDVLAKAGITLTEPTEHHILDSYILATGSDGYFVIYSGAELQPGLHRAQVIVAIAQSGQPLTRTGAFQLIDPVDVKPARWVRNLESLTVVPVAGPAH